MDKPDYIIDPEIQALLTPLGKEEFDTLEKLITERMHVDPLVLLKINGSSQLVLGDGHNRRTICEMHGITAPTRVLKVDTREEALQWVIDNQLGRRNLTDERRAYYRGREYLTKKKTVGGHSDDDTGETAKAIAEKHGVSARTVERDAQFAKAVDELPKEEKEKVLAGSGPAKKEMANGVLVCERCKRKGKIKDCAKCKELRDKAAKPKKKKAKPAAKPADDSLPKKVQQALADTWHAECARLLSKMRTEVKGAVTWSEWLDGIEVLKHLKAAQACFETAIPRRKCPECGGQQKVDKKNCQKCRGCGYLSSQK